MISITSDAAAANPELISETGLSEAKQAVLDEIGARWNKFSEQELSSLTGNYDLVNKIVDSSSSKSSVHA
jgi:hypothetical protein